MSVPVHDKCRTLIPTGLLGTIFVLLAIESSLRSHDLDFTATGPAMWHHAARAADLEAKGCEILFFGDSLVNVGVAPRVIEAQIGRRGLNLAFTGGQPTSSFFLLQRALHAGAKPVAVVVDFKANMIAVGPQINRRQWPEILSAHAMLELAWRTRDASFFGNLLVSRLFPSFKARKEICGNLMAALSGKSGSSRAKIVAQLRNWEVNRGANIMPESNESRSNPIYLSKQAYFPDEWRCESVNYFYLRRFLELAAKHKILVFWLLPPIVPSVQAKREQLGLDDRYMQIVHAVRQRFSNLIVIDGRHSNYVPTVFFDPAHLDRHGAAALSTGLAEVLRPFLAGDTRTGPRLVPLPSYRRGLHEEELEDLNQSILARASDGRMRR